MDAEQPTVAAVDGAVRAGGLGLMASCDLVVVHRSVTFALTEVRIGVAPAIISVPILRRVAPSRIAAAMLTGEPFDADEARAIGLITHVTDDVVATTAALCAGIIAGAPRAVAETKRLLHRVPGLDRSTRSVEMRALSDELFSGPDAAEGMAAFREKRTPQWDGAGRPSPQPPELSASVARGAISSRQIGTSGSERAEAHPVADAHHLTDMGVAVADALPLHEPPDRLVGPHVVQPVGVGASDPGQLRQTVDASATVSRPARSNRRTTRPSGRARHARTTRARSGSTASTAPSTSASPMPTNGAKPASPSASRRSDITGSTPRDDGERHVLVVPRVQHSPADRVAATVGTFGPSIGRHPVEHLSLQSLQRRGMVGQHPRTQIHALTVPQLPNCLLETTRRFDLKQTVRGVQPIRR